MRTSGTETQERVRASGSDTQVHAYRDAQDTEDSEVTRFPVRESRPAASAGSQTLLNKRAREGGATVGVGGAGGFGAGEEEVLAESEDGGGRAKGSEGALPVSESMPVSDALPVSESMSLAEIRDFIRKERLEASVKTSGSGKTS